MNGRKSKMTDLEISPGTAEPDLRASQRAREAEENTVIDLTAHTPERTAGRIEQFWDVVRTAEVGEHILCENPDQAPRAPAVGVNPRQENRVNRNEGTQTSSMSEIQSHIMYAKRRNERLVHRDADSLVDLRDRRRLHRIYSRGELREDRDTAPLTLLLPIIHPKVTVISIKGFVSLLLLLLLSWNLIAGRIRIVGIHAVLASIFGVSRVSRMLRNSVDVLRQSSRDPDKNGWIDGTHVFVQHPPDHLHGILTHHTEFIGFGRNAIASSLEEVIPQPPPDIPRWQCRDVHRLERRVRDIRWRSARWIPSRYREAMLGRKDGIRDTPRCPAQSTFHSAFQTSSGRETRDST